MDGGAFSLHDFSRNDFGHGGSASPDRARARRPIASRARPPQDQRRPVGEATRPHVYGTGLPVPLLSSAMAVVIPHDVFFATIPELSARLKKKEFKAEDLIKAFAARLVELGPRY